MKGPVRLELSNGAVLLLRENHAGPSVAFRGSFRAGAAYGPPSAAEFAARTILRGTDRLSAARVARDIEALGSALDVSNGDETTIVHGRCTAETLEPTLRILIDSLTAPSFKASELEKVRGEVLGDIRADQDDTRHVATRRLMQIVYPASHPYHRDSKGDERSVRGMTRGAVRDLHGSRYVGSGAIFAFSGDLDEDTFRGSVASAFERIERGRRATLPKPPKGSKRGRAIVRMPHKSQADVIVGRVAFPRTHPDYDATNLANLLFGRIGLYGRLGERVREGLGLAYYSYSVLDARLAGGHWYANAGVNPKNLHKALAAIRAEMERLVSEPFNEREIRDGKNNIIGSLQVTLERNAEYASALHDVEYYGLGTDFLARYPSVVRRIKRDAIRAKAKEYLDPDACSWVVSGPAPKAKLAF